VEGPASSAEGADLAAGSPAVAAEEVEAAAGNGRR
jgi:hypothetical protein